jgi:hypothetical protein
MYYLLGRLDVFKGERWSSREECGGEGRRQQQQSNIRELLTTIWPSTLDPTP